MHRFRLSKKQMFFHPGVMITRWPSSIFSDFEILVVCFQVCVENLLFQLGQARRWSAGHIFKGQCAFLVQAEIGVLNFWLRAYQQLNTTLSRHLSTTLSSSLFQMCLISMFEVICSQSCKAFHRNCSTRICHSFGHNVFRSLARWVDSTCPGERSASREVASRVGQFPESLEHIYHRSLDGELHA
jgi:hypothetical protein